MGLEVVYLSSGLMMSDIAIQFPGIPLQTLKQRYRNMKAKTMEWSSEDVYLLW